MIFSKEDLFSNQQAVTASAASTNVIDLGATGIPYGNAEALKRDIGKGNKVPLRVQVTEDFATLTSLTITVQTSDDAAFGSGVITHATTGAVAAADLVAGWSWGHDVIPYAQAAGMGRYMRLNYTVTGTAATAGKVTAGVTMGNQTNV
jgi:hypothetical protein